MDTTFFLDINSFARDTSWAHSFMHAYALYAGPAVLALLVLVGFWRARGSWLGASTARVASTIWVPIGAVIAFGLSQPLTHVVGRVRPYYALAHVEVLVPRGHDFSFPSDRATVAGAAIAGLWLSRDRLVAPFATLLALLLAFAGIYVGASYPSDAAAGLVFGAVVTIVGWVLVAPSLEALVAAIARGQLGTAVGGRRSKPLDTPGPAATPVTLAATGAVRIIETTRAAPRHLGAVDAVPGGTTDENMPSS